jgi:very-short-patch-repair endonuclease
MQKPKSEKQQSHDMPQPDAPFYCWECKIPISEKVYNFSKNKYGKPLCWNHQQATEVPPPPTRSSPTASHYFCYICRASITEPVYNYSTMNIGMALCRNHQNTVTPEAIKLSKALKDLEVTHTLEAFDGYKHVDIAIESAMLYIELDGSQHNLSSKQLIADFERDKYSRKDGYDTIRVPNERVSQNVYRLASNIKTLALKREAELKEARNKLTVTGIMKSMIKTAVKLSKKLEEIE